MASVTLDVSDVFSVGDDVSVWLDRCVPAGEAPMGPEVETATVASGGALTYSALASGETYVAYLGGYRRRFTVGEDAGLGVAKIVGAVGTTQIVAAQPGRRIRVTNYVLVAAGAATATWKSGTTAISGDMGFAANGGVATDADGGLIETALGEPLQLTVATNAVAGHLTYEYH